MSSLSVRNLTASWHRDDEVLGYDRTRRVDFTCPPGKTLAVVGDEGVGRTTLLHAIAGTVPYVTGKVALGDQTLLPCDPAARFVAGVQHVPQEPCLLGGDIPLSDAWSLIRYHRPGLFNEAALDNLSDTLVERGFIPKDTRGHSIEVDPRLFDLVLAIMSVPRVLLLDEAASIRFAEPDTGDRLYLLLRKLLPWTILVVVDGDSDEAPKGADLELRLKRDSEPEVGPVPRSTRASARAEKGGSAAPDVDDESRLHEEAFRLRGLPLGESPRSQLRLALRANGLRGDGIEEALDRLRRQPISFLRSKHPASRLSSMERLTLLWALEELAGLEKKESRIGERLPKSWRAALERWLSEDARP